MSSRLERMEAFIADFRTLRRARREERMEAMETFLATFEETHRRIWRTRVDFNLFSLLGVRTDEVRHSGVLAWLLDAESGHGQGVLFMRAFANLCDLDLPVGALDRYSVRTEFVGKESIIDVAVWARGQFLVYLENKVLAPEQSEQVDREFRDMHRLGAALSAPRSRQFAIFLTPQGRAPISGDPSPWRTVSYPDLADAFTEVIPGVTSDAVRIVLTHWIEAVSCFGGVTDESVV